MAGPDHEVVAQVLILGEAGSIRGRAAGLDRLAIVPVSSA